MREVKWKNSWSWSRFFLKKRNGNKKDRRPRTRIFRNRQTLTLKIKFKLIAVFLSFIYI